MENLPSNRTLHPVSSIVTFAATLFLGFFLIGPLVGFLAAVPFYEGSFFELIEAITNGNLSAEVRLPMLIMQGCASAVGLIVVPALVYSLIVKMKLAELYSVSPLVVFALTGVSVVAFMFPNSVIIEWNANLKFSGAFWDWARGLEDSGEKLTKFMTSFESTGDFILVFLIVAVLPAIGEEFVFRGWLQPALQKITNNPHVSIWITAAVFSAIHLQFFGFVPRLLLGAMFGYLMYWSNNLWVPIFAHFVNNGFSVVMMFLFQQKIVAFDPESTESLPLVYVIPFTVVFLVLIIYLKKIIEQGKATTEQV